MLIHFDFASGVPLYRQLRDQIVLGLAEGRLAPGEKLPPVRVLAEGVLELEKSTGCDFLHLGSALEMRHPVRLRGAAENLALVLPDLDMRVCVSARLDRSFKLDLKETGQ